MWRRIIRRLKYIITGKRRQFPFYLNHELEYGAFDIGKWSYGGMPEVVANGCVDLKIGKYCSIAKDVTILLKGDHDVSLVTTYPFNSFWPEARELGGHPVNKGPIIIGNDVWIGQGAYILSGVTIADGAVVGAGAVVTKDVPPYAIAAGNPAKVIRLRFPTNQIAALLQISWWDWPEEKIRDALPFLLSPKVHEFIDRYSSLDFDAK